MTEDKPDGIRWMYATLPANVVTGSLSTLISLYILSLGGGVIEVSEATIVSAAITVPAVFLWGFITDMLNQRKVFILFAYAATTLSLVLLYIANTSIGVIGVYALITFVSAATAAPINLMVMETGIKSRWPANFAALQTIAAVGTTLGLVIGFVLAWDYGLHSVIIALGVSSLISTLMALKMVTEPAHEEKRMSISQEVHSFLYRVASMPGVLIRIPNPRNLRSVFGFGGLRKLERNFVIVFYVISFIFFFGTGIFNTEYSAALNLEGLNESVVFFVIFIAMVVQAVMLHYYSKFTINSDKKAVSSASLVMRGAGYAIVGISFLFMKGTLFLVFNILFYTLASGIAYSLYYPTAYGIFFETLSQNNRGRTIGIYTAIVGLGTLAGAYVSGAASVALGFGYTFVLAALFMIIGGIMFSALPTRN